MKKFESTVTAFVPLFLTVTFSIKYTAEAFFPNSPPTFCAVDLEFTIYSISPTFTGSPTLNIFLSVVALLVVVAESLTLFLLVFVVALVASLESFLPPRFPKAPTTISETSSINQIRL